MQFRYGNGYSNNINICKKLDNAFGSEVSVFSVVSDF